MQGRSPLAMLQQKKRDDARLFLKLESSLFSEKNLSRWTKELKFSLRARSNNPLFLVLEVSFIYSDETPVRERPFVFLYSNS